MENKLLLSWIGASILRDHPAGQHQSLQHHFHSPSPLYRLCHILDEHPL